MTAEEGGAEERRIYQRLNNIVNIRYKAFSTQEDSAKRDIVSEHLSACKNISAGGVLFIADESLSVGSILELKVELPGKEPPIEGLAKVVRVVRREAERHFETAVCFLDITSAERARIEKYIKTEAEE